MSPGAHALLSASSAHRWLACPGSVMLEQQYPDEGSPYAAEGTLAHELAELKARKAFVEPMGPQKYAAAKRKLKASELWADEMDACTDIYLEVLKDTVARYDAPPHVVHIGVEQRVDFSRWVPEGFGTADCIIIGGTELCIIDYKHGKGVKVEAQDNPQLMLYALGAYDQYRLLTDIQTVRMTIVQPRLDSVSTATIGVADLLDWADAVVKPKAAQAARGEGGYKAGDHCRFCKARQQCRARAVHYLQQEPKDKELLTAAEIGAILVQAQGLKAWVSDLEEYALSQALAGEEVPGWKAVEGRSVRAFTDQDAAFDALIKQGVAESLLYERKPITLSTAEKLVGKARFAEVCGPWISKPQGKPTLVPATDKRPAITNQITAAEAFAPAEE